MNNSYIEALRPLFRQLSEQKQAQSYRLILLMIVGGISELVSLGMIIPFLALLINPETAFELWIFQWIPRQEILDDIDSLRAIATILFALASIVAGFVRFFILKRTANFIFGIGHELGVLIYRKALNDPYEKQVLTNSSVIIGGLNKLDQLTFMFFNFLNMANALFMAICIVSALLIIDYLLTAVTFSTLGFVYGFVYIMMRKRLNNNSHVISSTSNVRMQIVQEGLGSIRDVIIEKMQPFFGDRFNDQDLQLRNAQASNNIISPSPRFAVEAVGLVLIATVAYAYVTTSTESELAAVIPILGALALGAQRLLPLMQQIYYGLANYKGQEQLILDMHQLLGNEIDKTASVSKKKTLFQSSIVLKDVGYRYSENDPFVLEGINLSIYKGETIGLVGTTGSGKTTLIDLIMGLLDPTEGELIVDGNPLTSNSIRHWQDHITHVPQEVFLMDDSLNNNIAYGESLDEISTEQIQRSISVACIKDLYDEQQEKESHLFVGERGVRLSGGQRQRIGIARAIYRDSDVLVLDEATSNLDPETEEKIIRSIRNDSQEKTLIIIAHRHTTLRFCEKIYLVENKDVELIGNFEDLTLGKMIDMD